MMKNGAFSNLYLSTNYVINRIAPPNWQIGSKALKLHSLLYIYSGEGIFQCDNTVRKAGKHSLVYFPRGCYQKIDSGSCTNLKYYTINFFGFLVQNYDYDYDKGHIFRPYHKWDITDAEFDFPFIKNIKSSSIQKRLAIVFEKLCRMYMTNTDDMLDKINRQRSLLELIALADRVFKTNSQSKAQIMVDNVTDYIISNYQKKLTLNELAEVAEVAPTYLISIFKQLTKKTPIDYVSGVRISKAKQFLDEGCSVGEVAEMVGFSDIFYFSNCFKKHEGISPSAYRKRHLNT